jgi:peptidoglycan-N-acetylglucosamine deacetylase
LVSVTCTAGEIATIDSTPAPIRFLLSFDDGPSAKLEHNPTEQILATLAKNNVQSDIKVIFFTQTRAKRGGGTEYGKKIMQREWDDGHLLALHTATPGHTSHRYLDDNELEQSLEYGIADLTEITGSPPQLVRPPFWSYDKRTFAAYQKNQLHVLLTDLSANDGKIWGVNFSFTKHRNMHKQLAAMREMWLNKKLPVVDNVVPIIVTFHDVNSYTADRLEEYLQILLQVADELAIQTTTLPFYNNREELERAAMARTLRDVSVRPRLPGLWDWLQ